MNSTMLMKGLTWLAIFLWLPTLWAGTLEDVAQRGTLRIGTTGDYPPFSLRAENGDGYSGIDIDMALLLAESLGVKAVFVPTTWSELSADVRAGKFDIAMSGITITEARRLVVAFTAPYFRTGKSPLVLKRNKTHYQTIAAINSQEVRLLSNVGGTNEIFAKKTFPLAKLILVKDNLLIDDYLLEGKADVMVTDNTEAAYHQFKDPRLYAVSPDKPFTQEFGSYMLVQNDPEWLAYLQAWLQEVLCSDQLAELEKKWFGTERVFTLPCPTTP